MDAAVMRAPRTLFIACGALARELVALKQKTGWSALTIACLPADLHNRPDRIAPAVQAKIRAARGRFERIFVIYGDCGTGGALDRVLEAEGVSRIPGPHCYQFFMGAEDFTALSEAEPGCFYLTDYLARHFERIVIQGLGLDRYPDLREAYFGNYTRLIYIAQSDDSDLEVRAQAAADRLGLIYERRLRHYGELGDFVHAAAAATASLTASLPASLPAGHD